MTHFTYPVANALPAVNHFLRIVLSIAHELVTKHGISFMKNVAPSLHETLHSMQRYKTGKELLEALHRGSGARPAIS